MKIRLQNNQRGIAIMIVMIVILVLTIIAGGFAYSMKVEMRLAQQANYESDFEWMGRSGVELARCVLVEQFKARSLGGGSVDALNQQWAGGLATNSVLPDLDLKNVELGPGILRITIVDAERKFNLNRANQGLVQNALSQAMILMGVDPVDGSTISDSILDWTDPPGDPRISGAEADYYANLDPPYEPKNGPLDDITELLLVKGVTQEIFWGSHSSNVVRGAFMDRDPLRRNQRAPEYRIGLNDLFTTVSRGRINVNTASADVLQLVVSTNTASAIIQRRAGPDGQDGTEDDLPFQSANDLSSVPGMEPGAQLGSYFDVQSRVFEVRVLCEIGNFRREYIALIDRMNQRDAKVLWMYWKSPDATAATAQNQTL